MNCKGWHISTIVVVALVALSNSVAGGGDADDPPRTLAGPVADGPFLVEAHGLFGSARFRPDGFADHQQWDIGALLVVDGEAVVAARPDEPGPVHAAYGGDVQPHWHYQGKSATPVLAGAGPTQFGCAGQCPQDLLGFEGGHSEGRGVRKFRAGSPIPSRPEVRVRHHRGTARGARVSRAVNTVGSEPWIAASTMSIRQPARAGPEVADCRLGDSDLRSRK